MIITPDRNNWKEDIRNINSNSGLIRFTDGFCTEKIIAEGLYEADLMVEKSFTLGLCAITYQAEIFVIQEYASENLRRK